MLGHQVTNHIRFSKQEKSLKEKLLLKEIEKLKSIDNQCFHLLTSITTSLREQTQIDFSVLQDNLLHLVEKLEQQNAFFQRCVSSRPIFKHSQNNLFKKILAKYQNSKHFLDNKLQNLQINIQHLQSNGLQIFSCHPPKNNVIDQITTQRLNSYFILQSKYEAIQKLLEKNQINISNKKLAKQIRRRFIAKKKSELKKQIAIINNKNLVLQRAIESQKAVLIIKNIEKVVKTDCQQLNKRQLVSHCKNMRKQIEELNFKAYSHHRRSFSCASTLGKVKSTFKIQQKLIEQSLLQQCRKMFF